MWYVVDIPGFWIEGPYLGDGFHHRFDPSDLLWAHSKGRSAFFKISRVWAPLS